MPSAFLLPVLVNGSAAVYQPLDGSQDPLSRFVAPPATVRMPTKLLADNSSAATVLVMLIQQQVGLVLYLPTIFIVFTRRYLGIGVYVLFRRIPTRWFRHISAWLLVWSALLCGISLRAANVGFILYVMIHIEIFIVFLTL